MKHNMRNFRRKLLKESLEYKDLGENAPTVSKTKAPFFIIKDGIKEYDDIVVLRAEQIPKIETTKSNMKAIQSKLKNEIHHINGIGFENSIKNEEHLVVRMRFYRKVINKILKEDRYSEEKFLYARSIK